MKTRDRIIGSVGAGLLAAGAAICYLLPTKTGSEILVMLGEAIGIADMSLFYSPFLLLPLGAACLSWSLLPRCAASQ